jgi:hypothetical protein
MLLPSRVKDRVREVNLLRQVNDNELEAKVPKVEVVFLPTVQTRRNWLNFDYDNCNYWNRLFFVSCKLLVLIYFVLR